MVGITFSWPNILIHENLPVSGIQAEGSEEASDKSCVETETESVKLIVKPPLESEETICTRDFDPSRRKWMGVKKERKEGSSSVTINAATRIEVARVGFGS